MPREFYLNFSIPAWSFFILAWVLIFLGIFYYWKTIPPLSRYRSILLSVIRSTILVIVLFLLLYPVLQTIFEKKELPKIAVLLDNSESMQIQDKYGMRGDSLNYLLNILLSSGDTDSLKYQIFKFGKSLQTLHSDSLMFNEENTNLSSALIDVQDSLADQNLQAIILVSDGQYTLGSNPLNNLNKISIPVFTAAVGDSSPHKDLKISEIRVNRVAYQGEEISIKVSLMQEGYERGKIMVRLNEGPKQVEARTIELPPSGFEKELEFSYKPQQTGDLKYTISLDQFEDEISTLNNRSSFLLKVLKSKQKVLLISGHPSFDQQMIDFVLERLPDVNLTKLTEKSNGFFYENNSSAIKIDSFDVFILLGYPTSKSRNKILEKLLKVSLQKNVPLFFILSDKVSISRLSLLKEILPISINSVLISQKNVNVRLSVAGRLHPVTRLEENPDKLQSLWTDLPPVTSLGSGLRIKDASSILLDEAGESEKKTKPILLASKYKGIKTLLLAAMEIGGWHFQLQDNMEKESFFRRFLQNAIKWLINREDIQRIQIKPKSEVFNLGEIISFSGEVLDEFYQPVKNAEVKITILGDSNYVMTDQMSNINDFYSYQTTGLPAGLYKYKLNARKNDRLLSQSEGNFLVQTLAIEMQQMSANFDLMKQIADRTGGKYVSVKNLVGVIEKYPFKTQIQQISKELDLWNKLIWLILLIFLLSVEWFLRKRWGLL